MEKIDGTISGALSNVSDISGELQGVREVSGAVTSAPSTVERNYNKLDNKPQIESVTLEGNKTFRQLGMAAAAVSDVEKILYLG